LIPHRRSLASIGTFTTEYASPYFRFPLPTGVSLGARAVQRASNRKPRSARSAGLIHQLSSAAFAAISNRQRFDCSRIHQFPWINVLTGAGRVARSGSRGGAFELELYRARAARIFYEGNVHQRH